MPGAAAALEVNISADLASVEVMHHGRKVTIMRNQDQGNSINPEYARTSRKCPPFCIQPIELAPGVKTVAELEVLHFLKQISDGDASMLVIDSHPAHKILWYRGGMQDWESLGLTTLKPARH